MTQRTQFDRAYNTGEVTSGQPEGTPFVNFADLNFIVQGPASPIDILPVRHFSASADYATNDIVAYQGKFYAAVAPVTAGAFDAGDWAALSLGQFDAITLGVGWDFSITYDSDDNPSVVVFSLGPLRVRMTLTFTDGEVTSVLYETSIDSGSNYTGAGTLTLTYTDGLVMTGAWS